MRHLGRSRHAVFHRLHHRRYHAGCILRHIGRDAAHPPLLADGEQRHPWKTIVLITLSKAALGILLGYLADLLFGRWFRAQKSIHSFCEREHCDCDEEEGSVFLAALRHTLKIAAMLIAVNFALNLLFHYIGVERLSGTVLNRPSLESSSLALFGLIELLRFRRRDGAPT